ncbi:aldehyde dehydrogenase (NADP(+)) [Actinorugispora endophytica]|uniref:NADP-dependent aldehyde dehydrogenase n=1 Tax=Actinorugispora endophytica TaxID=1605990 RepID=A0A4R6V9C1_9ACTN|nr:aldehyde dehydrogenase (NADP(+)) [Actinorugispora endophytica]TDQ53048.1 NADP-dependent aldehyde dehydrogenase [Actinorugispora endophytica]
MPVDGKPIVAGKPVEGGAGSLQAVDPATGEEFGPAFGLVDARQIEDATRAAEAAFDVFRAQAPDERASFLRRVADNIEAIGPELTARAVRESGLPQARLEGERARTVGQLRMFADVVAQGDALQARIDPALPDRKPAPRPDLRLAHVPVGPVVVFGASNFPLAFSTAGGDTASALAAGCPVVVKAHNAHPGTAELVGQAVAKAVADSGLPGGVFSLLFGEGNAIGQALVADPRIKAVGFTGSRAGGLALMRTAAARPEPIPVFAEMSSTNPVVVLPGALAGDAVEDLAAAYVGSLTLGSGQFCTNPGLVFVPSSPQGDRFVAAAGRLVAEAVGQTMLTGPIARAFEAGVEALAAEPGVETVARGTGGSGPNGPAPGLFTAGLASLTANPRLQEEVFGAAGLVVRYPSAEALAEALEAMEGQLTATLHADSGSPADVEDARLLIPVLERRVGRIVFGGWPTGVEVAHAMVHGGPFPATSDPRGTSVGSLAVHRFLRPVSYQGVPDALLPPALREANPWNLNRRVEGAVVPGGEQ